MQLRFVAEVKVSGTLALVQAGENETVDDLKACLQEQFQISPCWQVLVLQRSTSDSECHCMEPGQRLSEFDLVSDDEVVQVSVRHWLPPKPLGRPPVPQACVDDAACGVPRPATGPHQSVAPCKVFKPLPLPPRPMGPVPVVREAPSSNATTVATAAAVPVAAPAAPAPAVPLAPPTLPAPRLREPNVEKGSVPSQRATPSAASGTGVLVRCPPTCTATAVYTPAASRQPTPPGSLLQPPPGSQGMQSGRSRVPAAAHAARGRGPSPGAPQIKRTDLERVGKLGAGAFGSVTLQVNKHTGESYALKAVSKGYLAHLRMEYAVLNEKKILRMVDSPFVVRLIATYNGAQHVYFLLEAALGGELFATYERLTLYGSEQHARFYVGCTAEALTHLHDRHVIYRDLKPENLLLDARGYCKLTDMGLAKVTHGLTKTLVGTPDYMAPEVIKAQGYGRAVDWWMLGVLLFELLVGRAPFEAENTPKVYENIKRGIDYVQFPTACRPQAQTLVRALCQMTPEARVRTPRLREDGWFKGFDWAALRAQRLQPPYVPRVEGPRDLSNFRTCDEEPQWFPYYGAGASASWEMGFEDDTVFASPVKVVGSTAMITPNRVAEESMREHGGGNALIYSPRMGSEAASYRPPARPAAQVAPLPGSRWQLAVPALAKMRPA